MDRTFRKIVVLTGGDEERSEIYLEGSFTGFFFDQMKGRWRKKGRKELKDKNPLCVSMKRG